MQFGIVHFKEIIKLILSSKLVVIIMFSVRFTNNPVKKPKIAKMFSKLKGNQIR